MGVRMGVVIEAIDRDDVVRLIALKVTGRAEHEVTSVLSQTGAPRRVRLFKYLAGGKVVAQEKLVSRTINGGPVYFTKLTFGDPLREIE